MDGSGATGCSIVAVTARHVRIQADIHPLQITYSWLPSPHLVLRALYHLRANQEAC